MRSRFVTLAPSALLLTLFACAAATRATREDGTTTACGARLSSFARGLGSSIASERLPGQETVERDVEVARIEVPCTASETAADCSARVRGEALEVAREREGLRWRVELSEEDGVVVAEFRVGRERLEGRFASFEEIAARMRAEQARGIDVTLVRAERVSRAGRATAIATRPTQEQRDVGEGLQLRWDATQTLALRELAHAARAAGLDVRAFEELRDQRSAVVRCTR